MAKPISSLSPNVDMQLAGMEQVRFRLSHLAEPSMRPTITLSRQFGAEAFPLAEQLKDLMEQASGEPWNIFDKAMLETVSQEDGISLRLLKNLGDMTRALDALGLYTSDHITHDVAFERVAKYLTQIAKVGNAIIVGRGGAILCQEMKNCCHFRLEASFEWRVASIMRRLEMDEKEARETVKTNEKHRERFISDCLGADITDIRHYDAIFNNERRDTAHIAAAIHAYVKSRWPDPKYFKKG